MFLLQKSNYPGVSICCPGSNIPKWFSYRSEGPSINIDLPSNWHNANFLGFALCVVVASEGFNAFETYVQLSCDFELKTNDGKSHACHWLFHDIKYDGSLFYTQDFTFRSKNVFMWYKHENYHDCLDAIKASFDFELLATEDYYGVNSVSCKVFSCGIRILYLQDAEEFGIIANKYRLGKSHAIIDDPEQSGSCQL